MQDGILVGIDAGTSVITSVAFTADGTVEPYGCAGKVKAA